MKNKKYLIYLLISILVLLAFAVKTSYSYFSLHENKTKNTKFDANFSCVQLDFYEEDSGGDLQYYYPIKDDIAFDKIIPVNVVIKNNCQNDINYTFLITTFKEKNKSEKYLKDNEMRIMVLNNNTEIINKKYLNNLDKIKEDKESILYNKYKNTDYKLFDLLNFYKLDNNIIQGNSEKKYNVYLWIDYYEGDITKSGLYDNKTKNKIFKYQLDLIINN